ncbi:MAG TPA: hypothetical protein VGJ86_13260 [Acidimicrobiales bacterium]|jgi:hypothetical protein
MWWHKPRAQLYSRFDVQPFDYVLPAFAAYAVFALALGAFAGTFIRRAVPAMATTLFVFIAVRIFIEVWARPRYLPLKTAIDPVDGPHGVSQEAGDWIRQTGWADRSGHRLSAAEQSRLNSIPSFEEYTRYIREHGLREWVKYHPANTYWQFQLIETGIFLGLAAILVGLVVWRVRRRAT